MPIYNRILLIQIQLTVCLLLFVEMLFTVFTTLRSALQLNFLFKYSFIFQVQCKTCIKTYAFLTIYTTNCEEHLVDKQANNMIPCACIFQQQLVHLCSLLTCLQVTCHPFGVISSGICVSSSFKVMLIHDMSVLCYSKRHYMGESDAVWSSPITNDTQSSD